jgi:cytidylate kinase
MCHVIPFDGVSGSGKSTLARNLAGSIGYVHLNTGALYRAITAFMHKKNLSTEEVDAVLREKIRIVDGRFYVGMMDTTPLLHTQEVETLVAHVSCIPRVRMEVEAVQSEIIHLSRGVVLEGRNIAKRFPEARLKFFITASLEERARRRVERNVQEFGWSAPLEEVLGQLGQRDTQDMNREYGRLVAVDDAVVIDTTGRTITDTLRKVIDYYERACRHTLIPEAI